MLRKYLTLTLFSLASVLGASAQTHYRSHIHVGGHAGMTLSDMVFEPTVKETMTTGVTFGATFRYAEERHVGLAAEINFTQRGWAESYDSDEPFSYSRTLTYVDMPILTHIFFGPRRFKCFFNLGPEIGYMTGSSISSNFDYENIKKVAGYPRNRETAQLNMPVKNRFDYGITAGVGAEAIFFKKHSMTVEARYYYGLGSIFGDSKRDHFSASRTTSIALMLGYWFRVK